MYSSDVDVRRDILSAVLLTGGLALTPGEETQAIAPPTQSLILFFLCTRTASLTPTLSLFLTLCLTGYSPLPDLLTSLSVPISQPFICLSLIVRCSIALCLSLFLCRFSLCIGLIASLILRNCSYIFYVSIIHMHIFTYICTYMSVVYVCYGQASRKEEAL